MRLEVTKRAQREVRRLGGWWLEHRDKAPELFEEELAAAYAQIQAEPGLGQTYLVSRGRRIQRVLLPKTLNHVYYWQRSAERVDVVSVWGAQRGRGAGATRAARAGAARGARARAGRPRGRYARRDQALRAARVGRGDTAAARRVALRPLGIVYPVLFVLFVATNAKVYYLAPIYTMLFAAGAAAAEPFLARRPWRTPVAAALIVAFSLPAVPITLPLLSQEDLVTYSRALGMEPPATEKHEQGALPQSFADMHGWEDLVDAVARVAAELPPEERAGSIVLATNYGEAGALEVLGAGRELPPVVCGRNSYWEWRPATIDGTVIALRRSREELLRWFDSVERVDTVRCQWCMPYQNEAPVHLARGLRVPPEQLWLEIKRFQ